MMSEALSSTSTAANSSAGTRYPRPLPSRRPDTAHSTMFARGFQSPSLRFRLHIPPSFDFVYGANQSYRD